VTEESNFISTTTSEDLLRAAFKYHDALVSYAYGLLSDWGLAQDAVQETFIVLQRKHAQYRPGESLFGWMRQMVRYEALNIIRKRGKESLVGDEELFSLVDGQFNSHFESISLVQLENEKLALHHCMAFLEKDAVQMIMAFYRDRVSCQQIADAHHRSINAVRLILSRTRFRLRDCVKKRLKLLESNL
jgi:RNA polymerase sigma-70 factor (ECF subfamily)